MDSWIVDDSWICSDDFINLDFGEINTFGYGKQVFW